MTAQCALSFKLAAEAIQRADPEQQAAWAGGEFNPVDRIITFQVCNRPVSFSLRGPAKLIWADTGEDISDTPDSIPVMHYLQNARGAKPTGMFLPYRDLWGANVQSGPFVSRYEPVMAAKYSVAPGSIISAAQGLGAVVTEKSGDARIEVLFFPNVPMAITLFGADEELPAEAKFLYDAVVKEYLPTEDVIYMTEMLTRRLIAEYVPR